MTDTDSDTHTSYTLCFKTKIIFSLGHRNRHSNSGHENSITSQFFHPFGFGFELGFDDMFRGGPQSGVSDFSSFSTSFTSAQGNTPAVKRTSTSTRFINGKKITTKK